MAENNQSLPHSLEIRGRERSVINGVAEVVSCDGVVLEVELSECRLAVRGGGLRIDNFDSAKGCLSLSGRVDSLEYLKGRIKGTGLIERIFR